MSELTAAPDINLQGLEWFNVEAPLSLADLRGKFVILDFWTFCCINCIHVLAALRKLEARFPDEIAVIGVHSPKFAAEKEPDKVAQAIARYDIAHPVIQDPELRLWRAYGVSAWPTLAFIDPEGTLMGLQAGEVPPDRLIELMGELVTKAGEAGILSPRPLDLAGPKATGDRLAFPGKMKPCAVNGGRGWVIADSGHHQIVVLDEEGNEHHRYGAGAAGFVDAPADEARFHSPQGVIAADDAIFVADTGNHAIRRIDVATGVVDTLAGTGERGSRLDQPTRAADFPLASVWDLELDGERLYFANAGSHQLGLLDLTAGTVARLAGDGGEDIIDGPAADALLAQPSGLALNAERDVLYFVDSETSSLRALTLNGAAEVRTLVGTGLFDFGHRNGDFTGALFQHPLGVAWQEGRLLVADSYNGRIRIADLAGATVSDLDDDDFVCEDPLCLPMGEPAGVVADGEGRIFMSDTNNHRIVAYRPVDGAYSTWFA